MKYTYVFRGEVASKKNSRIVNRKTGRCFPSKRYLEWQKVARAVIMAAGRPQEPLKSARLSMVIYHGDMLRRDTNNATQGIQDVLVEMGVLEDDNWMVIGSPDVFHAIDVEDPRLEVLVEPTDPTDYKAIFKAARKAKK